MPPVNSVAFRRFHTVCTTGISSSRIDHQRYYTWAAPHSEKVIGSSLDPSLQRSNKPQCGATGQNLLRGSNHGTA